LPRIHTRKKQDQDKTTTETIKSKGGFVLTGKIAQKAGLGGIESTPVK